MDELYYYGCPVVMVGRCWPVSDDGRCGGAVGRMGIVVVQQ